MRALRPIAAALLLFASACGAPSPPGAEGSADAAATGNGVDARGDDVTPGPDGTPVVITADARPVPTGALDCTVDAVEHSYVTAGIVPTDMEVLDDGFLLLGWGIPELSGNARAWLTRVDEEGAVLWTQFVGDGSDIRTIEAGHLEADGRVTIVGRAGSGGAGYSHAWFAHIDSAGVVTDSRIFGSDGQDMLSDMVLTPGGLVAVGYKNTVSNAPWVTGLSATGATLWEKTYPGDWNAEDYQVIALPDGGYAIAASMRGGTTRGIGDARVTRIGPTGDTVYDKTYGEDGWDEARAIARLSSGDFAVAGYMGPQGWIARIDQADGGVVWDETLAPVGSNLEMVSVDVDGDDDMIAVGHPWWDDGARVQLFVYAADGTPRGQLTFGSHHVVEEVRWLGGGRFAVYGGYSDATGYRGGAWLQLGTCVPGVE